MFAEMFLAEKMMFAEMVVSSWILMRWRFWANLWKFLRNKGTRFLPLKFRQICWSSICRNGQHIYKCMSSQNNLCSNPNFHRYTIFSTHLHNSTLVNTYPNIICDVISEILPPGEKVVTPTLAEINTFYRNSNLTETTLLPLAPW